MRRILPTDRSIEATSTTSTATLTPIEALIRRTSSGGGGGAAAAPAGGGGAPPAGEGWGVGGGGGGGGGRGVGPSVRYVAWRLRGGA